MQMPQPSRRPLMSVSFSYVAFCGSCFHHLCYSILLGDGFSQATSICLGLAFASFDTCTVSMPSLNSAFTFSASASSGRTKLRAKLPYARSIAVILLVFLLLFEPAFTGD